MYNMLIDTDWLNKGEQILNYFTFLVCCKKILGKTRAPPQVFVVSWSKLFVLPQTHNTNHNGYYKNTSIKPLIVSFNTHCNMKPGAGYSGLV